jgi:branched-chain amino acid transport system ATP-binding protein
MNPLLDIAQLSAGYLGVPVLESLDLRVEPSERVALIGPNGCGKSTLAKAIVGIVQITGGAIHFAGQVLGTMPTERRIHAGISYLKQTRNVFPGLSVGENLGLAQAGDGGVSAERIADVLGRFPMIEDKMEQRAGLLSGGERQALALAMVLVRPVRLLLLDEPVAGVSQKNAGAILQGVNAMQERDGFALIMVEHRLRLIQPCVDRVVVMVRGRIAEDTRDISLLTDRQRLERHYML